MVYAPISASTYKSWTGKEPESFYEEVTQVFDHRKTQQTIIIGDFNAKIGEETESCLMKFSKGQWNYRGKDFIYYCLIQDLQIENTFFQKKLSRKWIWKSPNFETFNKIDYTFITKISNVSNIEVLNKEWLEQYCRLISRGNGNSFSTQKSDN